MPATIVVGTQWGDEGKGRVVDGLASQAQVVARFNGGDNAGHTVIAQGRTLKLHLVPSGILYASCTCLIGAGVIVNPQRLLSEMDELAAAGLDVSARHVKLDRAAHIILPTHRLLDRARETDAGKRALGTTGRGIGPTYADKAARVNLRAGAMDDLVAFPEAVADQVTLHNQRLRELAGTQLPDPAAVAAEYRDYAERLRPHLADGSALVGETLAAGQSVLCEGAQGTLLDLDHGTYPYVTSSSCVAGGACTGLGFGPTHVTRVVGIAKAYTTRVGSGPFPTELLDEVGERIRRAGHEFGTTTGRARRCGWLDLPILRYAARVNGLTEIALTKLDVLSSISPLHVAVAYESRGRRTPFFPAQAEATGSQDWQPVYEEWPAWDDDLSAARLRSELPAAARTYVERIEAEVGVPITFVGVGPERQQAITG